MHGLLSAYSPLSKVIRKKGIPYLCSPMPPSTRTPYTGSSRKLVLAFDVGTTYSGISYSILDPGQVPEIKGVTRFPAQEKVGGSSKIPTVIYYDKAGKVRAVGAEALRESLRDTIEDEGWVKAEWFKLHMRPKAITSSNPMDKIPPLPAGKSVVDLFGDFIRYLYSCAKLYITESHANGTQLWSSVERTIDFVLTHPNGWEGGQQQQMRKAAIQAGLVPDTIEGHARIRFVTEGEASLHFCIQSGLTTEALKSGGGVMIVDAGGGTIDLSAYGEGPTKGTFEEIASPQCHLQGSVYVTIRARTFLENYLRESKFVEDVEAMTEYFDKSAKLTFDSNPLFIKFGGARDRDPKLRIRGGQLTLSGTEVAAFFEPSVSCIIRAIKMQCMAAKKPISSLFLVGGFSASEYLFSKLKEELAPLGPNVCRPDSHLNKAVADGAVSFYLDHVVAMRVSRFLYGTKCKVNYDRKRADHVLRFAGVFNDVDGIPCLAGSFDVILPKDVQVSETQEFRKHYIQKAFDRIGLEAATSLIYCYRGALEKPLWWNGSSDFSALCTIKADTSKISRCLKPRLTTWGQTYYEMFFDIVLSFGLTELTAQIAWLEDGVEKRSPAKIVYDVDA
ncbi:hypothetical protein D9615_008998 [Tricholomella constricta]|uniref:Uncharacterized protein n=1 Tax=Tricholomella constricta TaxID=117010 RepID=A0A8H5H0T6_9AGAR|nr:hypothetical protein D9615_008998 [Tricholomella constricta]